jgi:hypothetical protein
MTIERRMRQKDILRVRIRERALRTQLASPPSPSLNLGRLDGGEVTAKRYEPMH